MSRAAMIIRAGTIEDAGIISQLVRTVAAEQIGPTLTGPGQDRLLSEMDETSMVLRLSEGFQFFLAYDDDRLVGVIAVRLPAHLYYLFVSSHAQRRGVGRYLWQHALAWLADANLDSTITVNSSLNAVAFYQRLGFRAVGAPQEMHGVRYQPMQRENFHLGCP